MEIKNIDDLIDWLEDEQARVIKSGCITKNEFRRAALRAKELKANMEAEDGWFSVQNMQPKPDQEILILYKENSSYLYEIGSIREDGTFYNSDEYMNIYNVTHWQPLPYPPKGEE